MGNRQTSNRDILDIAHTFFYLKIFKLNLSKNYIFEIIANQKFSLQYGKLYQFLPYLIFCWKFNYVHLTFFFSISMMSHAITFLLKNNNSTPIVIYYLAAYLPLLLTIQSQQCYCKDIFCQLGVCMLTTDRKSVV